MASYAARKNKAERTSALAIGEASQTRDAHVLTGDRGVRAGQRLRLSHYDEATQHTVEVRKDAVTADETHTMALRQRVTRDVLREAVEAAREGAYRGEVFRWREANPAVSGPVRRKSLRRLFLIGAKRSLNEAVASRLLERHRVRADASFLPAPDFTKNSAAFVSDPKGDWIAMADAKPGDVVEGRFVATSRLRRDAMDYQVGGRFYGDTRPMREIDAAGRRTDEQEAHSPMHGGAIDHSLPDEWDAESKTAKVQDWQVRSPNVDAQPSREDKDTPPSRHKQPRYDVPYELTRLGRGVAIRSARDRGASRPAR